MPRKPEVEQHPKKDQIIRALVKGETYREIKRKYNVDKSALSRYLNKKLMQKAAAAQQQRDLSDGNKVLNEIEKFMTRINKMYDACDRWLRDPDNEEEYYLGPRAEEVDIIYEEIEEKENGKEWKERRKAKLQVLLEQIDRRIVQVNYKYADPRELILKTAAQLKNYLELAAKIHGLVQEVKINLTQINQWNDIKTIILKATADAPEVRQRIVNEFAQITGE